MWQLQSKYKVRIHYHFFVSRYGKSLCDSHISVSKQHVRLVALSGTDIETVDQLVNVLMELNDTYAFNLGAIDRTLKYECLQFDDGIKKFHEFKFDKNLPLCFFRELSGDSD